MLYLWINIPYWLFIQKGKQQMKLKDYRTKNKLSCSELARKIGVQNINPATNVWRWENGQRIPRKEEMKKIYIGTEKQVQPNDFYDLKV
jgi:transcriptional regulator with XRE-family HTH domain